MGLKPFRRKRRPAPDAQKRARRNITSLYAKSKSIPLLSVKHSRSNLKFRSVTQSLDEAIVISDETGNIVFWDEGAQTLFGYAEKEILGRPLALLLPAKHSALLGHRLDHVLFSKASPSDGKTHELRGVRADGRRFPVELSLLTWQFGGKTFFTTILRDITERKRLQKEILEISGREQQRIGQDLHDGICQDLSAITLLTEVLKIKLSEKSLADAADVEEITRSIARVIIKTKALAKGLLPVELEAHGLMRALREMAVNTEKLARVSCRMESKTPVFIRDDTLASHLYRIAQEAVSNALKHAKAKNIAISLSKKNGEIVLMVRDDGIGIGDHPGHKGLGLSIMNSRAETINAILQIRKLSGGGTVLVCSLREPGAVRKTKKAQRA